MIQGKQGENMNSQAEQYLDQQFEKVRLLQKTEKSTVWLATDKTDKLVVIKEIQMSGLPYKVLKEKNFKLCPDIVYVMEDESTTVVVEEYVAGVTFQDKLAQQQFFDEQVATDILVQLCNGMEELHRAGIIHRDIKPANLILQSDKSVRLIDFDAARIVKKDSQSDTCYLGTKGYAPPEQYGFGQTDARSDIYALGITVKEMLGENYSGWLNGVLEKCTQVNPLDRYKSVRHLRRAILWHPKKKFAKYFCVASLIVAILLLGYSLGLKEQGIEPVTFVQQEIKKGAEEVKNIEQSLIEGKSAKEIELGKSVENTVEENNDKNLKGEDDKNNSAKSEPYKSPYRGPMEMQVLLNGGPIPDSPILASEWRNWQRDEVGKNLDFAIYFPDDWSIQVHFINNSGRKLVNPCLKISSKDDRRINERGIIRSEEDTLAEGESIDFTIPLGGVRIPSVNTRMFMMDITLADDQDSNLDYRQIQLYLQNRWKASSNSNGTKDVVDLVNDTMYPSATIH